jgi:MATE family multidrug resistance protein
MATLEELRSDEHRLKLSVAHDTCEPASGVVQTAKVAVVEGRPARDLPSRVQRELVKLAWPIAAALLGNVAMGLVDTKLAGGLGASALAGVGVGTVFMYLAYNVAFGLMRGVCVRTAYAVGEGRPDDGYAYARAGVVLGALLGVVVMLVCRDIAPVLVFIGADASLVPVARDFLAAVTLGAPATCALAALVQHRRGLSDARLPMVTGIAGNVVNAVLAWALIYGHLGLPALGVRGAGLATATADVLALLALGALFLRDARAARARSASVSPDLGIGRAAREVAELGMPTGAQFFVETLAFATFTAVLSGISKEDMASHQIALACLRVSFLPGVAVSEAASVLVGQALGRRRLAEADLVVRSALRIAVLFMAGCGLVFGLLGGSLAGLFSTNGEVIAITRRLLLVAALFQVLDAANIVLRGSLRGAKDVRVTAVIGILVIWGCVPTSAYLLGKLLGLGALGGWLGFVGETTLGALIFWRRWSQGAWRRAYAS